MDEHREARDEDLMSRIAGGDRLAFDVLAKRHINRVYAIARCMVKAQADAEDIAQDVFTRLWVYGPRWQEDKAAFTTWLYRIVVNCCHDHMRKNKKHQGGELDENIAGAAPDGEQQYAQTERNEKVKAALQALPERQRMAVMLCYFEGMTNPEAAAAMDMHIKALEGLLVRARRAMKGMLEEEMVRYG